MDDGAHHPHPAYQTAQPAQRSAPAPRIDLAVEAQQRALARDAPPVPLALLHPPIAPLVAAPAALAVSASAQSGTRAPSAVAVSTAEPSVAPQAAEVGGVGDEEMEVTPEPQPSGDAKSLGSSEMGEKPPDSGSHLGPGEHPSTGS